MPLKKEIPTNKGMRNSSIELLRIISMVMIVACHFATHSGFTYNSHTLSIPRFWLSFIEMGGKVGVDVFILISGYFLITNKRLFNLKRLLKFWGQVFFYSAGIYCVFSAIGVIKFSPLALYSRYYLLHSALGGSQQFTLYYTLFIRLSIFFCTSWINLRIKKCSYYCL